MYPANPTEDKVRTLKNAAQNIKDEAADTAHDVKEDIRETANKAGRKVRHFLDNAGEEISHATDTVSTQIRTNPLQSSLVALGVGFVLGLLYRR